jgi:hypothetical protein
MLGIYDSYAMISDTQTLFECYEWTLERVNRLTARYSSVLMIHNLSKWLGQDRDLDTIRMFLYENEIHVTRALYGFDYTLQQQQAVHQRLDKMESYYQVQELTNEIKSKYVPRFCRSVVEPITMYECPMRSRTPSRLKLKLN